MLSGMSMLTCMPANETVDSNFTEPVRPDLYFDGCLEIAGGPLWGLSCTWTAVVVFVVLMLLLAEIWLFEVKPYMLRIYIDR